jgi:hypothetical protein
MSRSLYVLCALGVMSLAVAGCKSLVCGPGTVQKQSASGEDECVPVDQQGASTPCDVDGGTVDDVGGQCVSHIKCDPATTLYDPVTGVCVGTGNGGGGCAACPNPIPAGEICVTGGIVDFQTGMHVMGGASSRPLQIGVYEPLGFISNPGAATPLVSDAASNKGCYTFVLPTPMSGLIALGVQDPATGPGANPPLVIGAAGATVVSGQKYNLDGYLILKSTLDGYAAVNPTFGASGAYVACYFKDPPPGPTNQIFDETMPSSGVNLLENGVTPAAARYLKADRTIDTTLTATGAIGYAVTPGNGNVNQYTGTGGGVTKWETVPGGSAQNVVFVARLHSCDGGSSVTTCQ